MFILTLSVFVTALVTVIALLWLIRMVRIWNGDIKSSDAMSWAFLMVTAVGLTASVLLIRMTTLVLTGA